MNDSVQCWSNPRIEYFKIWHLNSSCWWRREQIIHWINYLHFFDPMHSIRMKLWTCTCISLESYLPTSKCDWSRGFVKMKIRNLQSLLVCPKILWRSSLTRDDCISGWRSRLASLILILFSPFTLFHCGWMKRLFGPRNSMDSIPADNELKKKHVDLQKRFPIYHVCPKCLAAPSLRLGIPIERLSIPPGSGWGGKNTGWLVTWEFPLRIDSESWKSLESFIQLISFFNSCITPVSSKIVSCSSTNLRLAIVSKVELRNFFNSSILLRLLWWASCSSEFCCNNCAWRSCWSRRWSSSAWAQWSSSCWDSIIWPNFRTLLLS